MTREDLELYVSGNFDGDTAALEQEIASDPALAAAVADEARFEMLLRDAAAAAVFCPACNDVTPSDRCDACGAAIRPGGYTVERVLVSNAHGRMYVARDADDKQVALKELAFVHAPSPATIEAFEREAKFLRALEHPAIPRFVASFEEGRGVHARYYLAQELVVGTPLDRLEQKWYREDEIVDIARQTLAILVYLQSLSPMIIHRDIKPANLVRRPDGTIALVDFGTAYIDGARTGITTAVGTFGYMPVEQHAGIVDATTDLFALGASLLHLLTREEPWRLAQSDTVVNVSAPLRAYLDKLTAADPRQRFASAKEALTMLDRREQLVKQVMVKKPRVRSAYAIAAVVSSLSVAVGAGLVVSSGKHRPEPERPVAVPVPAKTTVMFLLRDGDNRLWIDGKEHGPLTKHDELELAPGKHEIRVVREDGVCVKAVDLVANQRTMVDCLASSKAGPGPRLDVTTQVTWNWKATPLHDVLRVAHATCGLNIVIADYIDPKVTARFTNTPCNEAVESMLEADGLWYAYEPATKLFRVAPRRELDHELDDALMRGPSKHARLPASTLTVDLEFKGAPLQQLTATMTVEVGKRNFVIPSNIDPRTTVFVKDVRWERVFEEILAEHGLWYRYREPGKVIRVAPRKELDAEEAAGR